jgi:hypothetical protein
MTGSVYGFGWPSANPLQQTPWGAQPQQQQIIQLLHSVPQQLQQLQQLTYLQQQQLQQIQQLLAYVVSQQFQQHPAPFTSPSLSTPFQASPFGQPFLSGQPGQVM